MDEALLVEIRGRARDQVRAEFLLENLIVEEGGDLSLFLIENRMDHRSMRALAHATIGKADPDEERLIPPALRAIIRAAQRRS